MNPWLPSLAIAYLLGSIPFGYLLVRIFLKQDIRASGSGNIGATNVARSGSRGLGIATLLLDLGKGYLAVVAAFYIAYRSGAMAGPFIDGVHMHALDIGMAAAIAAVLGHVFPVWLGFRGGKGVATAFGVFLALAPAVALASLVVFVVVFALTRFVSLGSILAAATIPLAALRLAPHMSHFLLFGFCFIPLVVILKHHQNIRRLLAGTESRFGSKKASA